MTLVSIVVAGALLTAGAGAAAVGGGGLGASSSLYLHNKVSDDPKMNSCMQ